jgi:hypothetical protein
LVAVGDRAQARDRAEPVAGEVFPGKDGENTGADAAAVVSTARMRACACSERSMKA